MASAGANTATTASARSTACWTPAPKDGTSASGPTSTVAAVSRPAAAQASATRTPSALELVTVATRDPVGSGWYASSWATSNSSVSVSTRMTPACSNNACTRSSGTGTARAASAGVVPAYRPLFTATTGLVRATRRASRANLRGLPKLSR